MIKVQVLKCANIFYIWRISAHLFYIQGIPILILIPFPISILTPISIPILFPVTIQILVKIPIIISNLILTQSPFRLYSSHPNLYSNSHTNHNFRPNLNLYPNPRAISNLNAAPIHNANPYPIPLHLSLSQSLISSLSSIYIKGCVCPFETSMEPILFWPPEFLDI